MTAWCTYRTVADALRRRLTAGEFSAGDALPSEAALCAEYRVARNTIRRALDQLADDGLIIAEPGRGRRVLAPNQPHVEQVPQYQRIAADLRAKIKSGHLRPGDPLPSEAALMASYNVARGTVRQALTDLAGAGLIDTLHGKGRFVSEPPAAGLT